MADLFAYKRWHRNYTMKKYTTLTFWFLFICFVASAQSEYSDAFANTASKGVVYNKEFTVDFRAHTNGFLALAANFGKIKTYYKTKYYHFEIGELKHNKEFRTRDFISASASRASSSYIYGKQNNFYVLRAGLGTKRYLTEKAARKGLAVGINYMYGPSLGIIKPYYIDINASDANTNSNLQVRSIRYSEEEAMNFLDISSNSNNANNIIGHSGFTKGFSEVTLTPGLHGKFGLHLDWGAFDEFVKAVEIGLMADVYFQTIPIMVDDYPAQDIIPTNVRNRPFFVNLYLSLQLGKRR